MHLRKSSAEIIVVGLGKNNRRFHHFTESDKLKFKPEPGNLYDPKAIKVIANDEFVGYIAKDYTGEIHRFLSRKDKEDNEHVIECFLLDVYPRSARFLVVDLTLALKRKK